MEMAVDQVKLKPTLSFSDMGFYVELASDGTEIYDYCELSVDEVLKGQQSHRRIRDDWETNHCLVKYSYCILEVRSYPNHAHKFTETEKVLLSSPLPETVLEKELQFLLSSWFNLFQLVAFC